MQQGKQRQWFERVMKMQMNVSLLFSHGEDNPIDTLLSIFLICMMNVSRLLRPNLLSWLLCRNTRSDEKTQCDSHMTVSHLPHANSLPVSVNIMVPSSPHFTLHMTSAILEPGLYTVTSTGWFLTYIQCGVAKGEGTKIKDDRERSNREKKKKHL